MSRELENNSKGKRDIFNEIMDKDGPIADSLVRTQATGSLAQEVLEIQNVN